MRSKARRSFWEYFKALPMPIQEAARAKYALWHRDPFHGSVQFKELRPNLWSVRINDNYRALARRDGELVVWFWIGTHRDYERLIKG
jgi:hypothetical protein